MRTNLLRKTQISFVFLFFTLSCGKAEQSGVQVGTGLTGISWRGIYKPAVKDSESKRVTMYLSDKETFEINSEASLDSLAKGSFTELPKNKKILFAFEESSFDLIGTQGSSQDYAYELNDDELILVGDRGEFNLKKSSTDGENSSHDEENFLDGDWNCPSNQGYSIEFNLIDEHFRGKKVQNGQSRMVYFEGEVLKHSIDEEKKHIVLLVVKTSNADKLIGSRLYLKEATEVNRAFLMQVNDGEELDEDHNASKILCAKTADP